MESEIGRDRREGRIWREGLELGREGSEEISKKKKEILAIFFKF